ncbi:hypothetical protein PR202_gb24704 [Eleusine coracana subsp. coracana]|uniref:Uncharacterized protein n=1 Tax=Eleusine coracana subsp. coracana TaxID=191504 RepID=A0AAV5FJD8_ELECO|nr:hypothetical protein PR202_gb24704 [Eleusine coracana subsp. coracana]
MQPSMKNSRVSLLSHRWYEILTHLDDEDSVRSKDVQPEYASEILEEFTTNRGELKRRASSFRDGRLLQLNSVKMTREFSRTTSRIASIRE